MILPLSALLPMIRFKLNYEELESAKIFKKIYKRKCPDIVKDSYL